MMIDLPIKWSAVVDACMHRSIEHYRYIHCNLDEFIMQDISVTLIVCKKNNAKLSIHVLSCRQGSTDCLAPVKARVGPVSVENK